MPEDLTYLTPDDRCQIEVLLRKGVAKGTQGPAALITAYRPNPAAWSDDLMRRKPQ